MPQKKPPTPATGPLDAFVMRPEPPKRMGRPPKRKRGGGRPKKKMNNKENDTESDKTEDLNSTLSERLRRAVDKWRRCGKEPGMTRRKLAKKYDVPNSTLCKYILSGKNVPEQLRCGRKPRYLSHESREVMVETDATATATTTTGDATATTTTTSGNTTAAARAAAVSVTARDRRFAWGRIIHTEDDDMILTATQRAQRCPIRLSSSWCREGRKV